jgi:hypothetical protein
MKLVGILAERCDDEFPFASERAREPVDEFGVRPNRIRVDRQRCAARCRVKHRRHLLAVRCSRPVYNTEPLRTAVWVAEGNIRLRSCRTRHFDHVPSHLPSDVIEPAGSVEILCG